MNKREEKKSKNLYHQGCAEVEMRNYAEAIRLFHEAAHFGSVHAMLKLGTLYYFGFGIVPNTEKAIHWLRLAAEKGSLSATLNLANVYYEMNRGKETDKKAWRYYEEASIYDEKHMFYMGRMYFDGRCQNKYASEEQRLFDGAAFFQSALIDGCALAALYLYKINIIQERTEIADECYAEGESLIEAPQDFNNWAYMLCEWNEYEKALPYIERCLSMMEQDDERPAYYDTYGECLYGLGRKDEAQQMFGKCLEAYRQRDERRGIQETWEKMKQLFGDSISFRVSVPEMERRIAYALTKES